MTEAELLGRLRERIGGPDRGEVSNDRLQEYVSLALVRLADELEFRVIEDDTTLALVAGQRDYPLPDEVLSVLWVEHADHRLEPVSLTAEDRDRSNWRDQEGGSPTRFAVRGRRLYLLPPPDSAAVTEGGTLSYSYVATPAEMGPQGPTGLSDSDQWLLVYLAAYEWCKSNPSEMNTARLQGYGETIGGMMATARKRWASRGAGTAEHHFAHIIPWTGGRMGGAR